MFVGATERATNPANSKAAANAEPGAAMGDAVRKLGEQVADVGGQVCRQAADTGRYVRQRVEEQPWTVLIATGVLGLVTGVLIGRASVSAPRVPRECGTHTKRFTAPAHAGIPPPQD